MNGIDIINTFKINAVDIKKFLIKNVLYIAGICFMGAAWVLLDNGKQVTWSGMIVWLIGIVFFWAKPCLEKRNEFEYFLNNFYVKWVMIILRGCILVVSGISVRWIISNATGVPSGDFPATFAILTILMGVFFWTVIATSLLWMFVIVKFCFMAFADILSGLPFCKSFRLTPLKRLIEFVWILMLVMTAGWLLITAGAWEKFIDQPRLVRLLAYWADYDRATNYPGVVKSLPFKLHDNGVVSYAIPLDDANKAPSVKAIPCANLHDRGDIPALQLLQSGDVVIKVCRVNDSPEEK